MFYLIFYMRIVVKTSEEHYNLFKHEVYLLIRRSGKYILVVFKTLSLINNYITTLVPFSCKWETPHFCKLLHFKPRMCLCVKNLG